MSNRRWPEIYWLWCMWSYNLSFRFSNDDVWLVIILLGLCYVWFEQYIGCVYYNI